MARRVALLLPVFLAMSCSAGQSVEPDAGRADVFALDVTDATAVGDDGDGAMARIDVPAMDARDGSPFDAVDAIATGFDASDIVPAPDAFMGTPCSVNNTPGVCLDTVDCDNGRVATPGHCPGPANIQCCTPPVDAGVAWDDVATGCPDDMVALPGFCMDRYEAPNTPGASPLAMQTAIDGQTWCAARGKRLCTEAEWVQACEGARGDNYPYGSTYVAHICNDDKTWIAPDWAVLDSWPSSASMQEAARLYQADPSGSRTGCRSEEGVMDMTGNVAEWVVRSFPNANNYDHVMKGCYWSGCYGGAHPSCSFVNPAHPGTFRSYEAGFRCCLTP